MGCVGMPGGRRPSPEEGANRIEPKGVVQVLLKWWNWCLSKRRFGRRGGARIIEYDEGNSLSVVVMVVVVLVEMVEKLVMVMGSLW